MHVYICGYMNVYMRGIYICSCRPNEWGERDFSRVRYLLGARLIGPCLVGPVSVHRLFGPAGLVL